MNYCLSTKWKAVYSFVKILKNISSLRNVLSRSVPFWMGFQWRYLWRGAFVMEAVVWLLGPSPLQDCWLLCVRASLAQGLPFPWGRPDPAPECLPRLCSSCPFLLCRTLLPLTSQGGCHWEYLPASLCAHLSLSLGFLTYNTLQRISALFS